MAQSKSRLGRGLGSLIAGGVKVAPPQPAAVPATTKSTAPSAPAGFEEIKVASISPSPYQARREIGPTQLAELTESIKAEGLLQPIVVRRLKDGRHELIAGERRWRAFQALKLTTIPARVVAASDASAAALGLIENLQREGLNPIEEAYGFASLIRDFDLTQEQAAERVGKGRASVANSLRLLSLDAELQGYLAKGLLSVGHAKVLLGMDDGAQRAVLGRRVVEEGLSVRGTETLVAQRKSVPVAAAGRPRKIPAAAAAAVGSIEKKLTSHLGARVTLHHTGRRGRIVIAYAGNDDLQRILEKIGIEA